MPEKPKVKSFEFVSYEFEPAVRTVTFGYRVDFDNREPLKFTERLKFSEAFEWENLPLELIDNVLSSLHIMLGISYYKLYCPKLIKTAVPLTKEQADFWNTVYQKGLGEFFYRNKIDSQNAIKFPYVKNAKEPVAGRLVRRNRVLLGIGGGKDSIVAAELLKDQSVDFTALLVETQKASPISSAVVDEMKVGRIIISRYLDQQIFQPHEGAYNGHIPISAIFAFIGYLSAVLYDYSSVIVANEYSSNFGNVEYQGTVVNHQWSKSEEFEHLFQAYAKKYLCPDIRFFSLLRPYYEIRIVKMFSKYKQYFPLFTSCNRSFRVHKERPESLWCGQCPKCAFMFLLLAAFLPKKDLLKIFRKNLLEDPTLIPLFGNVLGFGEMKPFDCVGTFEEAQAALHLAQKNYKSSVVAATFLPKLKKPEQLAVQVFKTNSVNTLPANYKLLGIENVLILGYGKEGTVSQKYIQKYFPRVKIDIADKKNGERYLEKQQGADLVIKTPGIPKGLVTSPYTTATNIFFSQVKNTIIGVTGSKGKSTTASLIYAILKEAGKKVTLLGNIGQPMLEVLMRPIADDEIFVLELSSYQLDDIEYSPQIALMLNLFPEHMNYHGSIEKYYQAKKNIINFQNQGDYFIYNEKDARLKKYAQETLAEGMPFNGNINLNNIKNPLPGRHNVENIKAAMTVAAIFNIPRQTIKKAIEKFQPLPHRLEYIGDYQGIKFYDDAISTTPESTIKALETIPNIQTILLGGEDRGYDFSELARQIKKYKIKNIVLFPDSGRKMLKSKKGLTVLETTDMAEAVKFAYEQTPFGAVCLLSTASPSYSLWKNFEEKGDQFQFYVKKFAKREEK